MLHPRCTILALSGPIFLGSNNILEENVVIVNRLKQPLTIGDSNLFQVGCRIESPTIGNYNNFGIRSRVSPHIAIRDNVTVGAGCIVLPCPFPSPSPSEEEQEQEDSSSIETLKSFTTVFGSDNRRRLNDSKEGTVQEKALFVKHIEYLRETLPKFFKLKMF